LLKRDIERELLPMAEAYGMSVAAYGALAGGVLSGKFTTPGGAPTGTRINPASLTPGDHQAARAVQEVAEELGVTASQVAIAWTRTRSHAVHPIIGSRNVNQLQDNLGALDVALPADAVGRLDAAVKFDLGYPTDINTGPRPWVFGNREARLEGRILRRSKTQAWGVS
jgi:aryl-alcohol dehydrogenase-like predicted oxidoreductase